MESSPEPCDVCVPKKCACLPWNSEVMVIGLPWLDWTLSDVRCSIRPRCKKLPHTMPAQNTVSKSIEQQYSNMHLHTEINLTTPSNVELIITYPWICTQRATHRTPQSTLYVISVSSRDKICILLKTFTRYTFLLLSCLLLPLFSCSWTAKNFK